MALDGTSLPPHLLRLMGPEDRAALGKGGKLPEEIAAVAAAKSEKELQDEIEAFCRVHEWPCYRQRMDKRSTGKVGQPDFLVCVGGRFVALECKVGNNQPTPEQQKELKAIILSGGVAHVVRRLEDACNILIVVARQGGVS